MREKKKEPVAPVVRKRIREVGSVSALRGKVKERGRPREKNILSFL